MPRPLQAREGVIARSLAEDQCHVRVSLTARSRTLAAAKAPQNEDGYATIEASIGDEFIQHFYATPDELIGMLDALPAADEL